MSYYERDIRPKLDVIYAAAQQGDFQTALDEMNKPATGIHPLRVPFEILRIADNQGNKEAGQPFIDRIHAYKPLEDITGQTSLKITFIAAIAKEQTNHADLYTVDDVAETLVHGIDTFQEAQINPNEYLYGQQKGINRPAFSMTSSGVPFGVNSAIDVCGSLADIGSAVIHFARERVTQETPPDTLAPLVNKLSMMLRPSDTLQDMHPVFAEIVQYLKAMKQHGMQAIDRKKYLELLGESVLQQLIIRYDNHPELDSIATRARESIEHPSATMEVAPDIKKQ